MGRSANQVTRGRMRAGNGLFTIVAQVAATVDPGSLIDAAGSTIGSITATGAALGDIVLCGPGVDLVGITVTAYVSAANTISVRVQNESGSTVDLASSTWNFMVIRPFFS